MGSVTSKPYSILITDDDSGSREALREIMEPEGYRKPPIDLVQRISMQGTHHCGALELSQMILRALTERQDLAAARALAGNLARRWDAHTTREEREVLEGLK